MELAKKYRWAKIGFIIMVLLNIITLISIWAIRPPFRFRHPMEGRERVQNFLEQELDLTNRQKQQLRELRRRHIRNTRAIMNNIQKLRSRYFDLLEKHGASNQSQRDSIVTQIGQEQVKLQRAMYNHLDSLRAMLHQDQQNKFDRIIEQGLRRPRGNPPGNF